MTLTVPYFKPAHSVTEKRLLPLIVERAKSRTAMIYKNAARPEDNRIEWNKEVQDMRHRISWEFAQTPESTINLQELSDQIPFLHRGIGWTKHEMMRINRSENNTDRRISTLVKGFANDEDILVFGGGTTGDPETGVKGMSDTGSNVTQTSTELNVTTIALAHSSLTAQIQELIDDSIVMYEDGREPLVLVLSPDVVSKAASVLSAINEKDTALDKLIETLIKRGGPGSGIVVTGKLDATVAKIGAMSDYAVTDGDRASCLYPFSDDFQRVITSPMEIRKKLDDDGLNYKNGYRILPQFYEQTAHRYGTAVVIA